MSVDAVTGPIDRPRVGVVKLASCDGCQLTLLDLEDELLAIAERYDLAQFPEATSRRWDGRFDLLLVEGSVSTPEHLEQVRELRDRSDLLVTIGACATAGGIQALRNHLDPGSVAARVYPDPSFVSSLATATPVADHVRVDLELRGCPIAPGQVLELLTALRVGRRPQLPVEAVCAACKRRGLTCLLVADGQPCLGPVTAAGCGALCPAFGRACYGCFGPMPGANVPSLAAWFRSLPTPPDDVEATFALFTNWSEPFRSIAAASRALIGHPDAHPTTTEPATEER